jgi:hypothetical protein
VCVGVGVGETRDAESNTSRNTSQLAELLCPATHLTPDLPLAKSAPCWTTSTCLMPSLLLQRTSESCVPCLCQGSARVWSVP